jgi:NACHT domain- and WD repeat-containing protein
MATVIRTFRVFVSSTFSDLVEERNALQRKVFPALASLCEKAGCRFQAIDLRWGITQEAGFDQRTARICLEEIDRCQRTTPRPNFIVLLGNRYGSRHLPEEMKATDFEQIEAKAGELNLAQRNLLREWYRRDDNALPPVYYLRRRAKDSSADYTEDQVWTNNVQLPIHDLLRTCAAKIPVSDDLRIKLERSLTEREILAGALSPSVPDAKEHVFAYLRNVEFLDQLETASETDYAHLWRFVDFARAAPPDEVGEYRRDEEAHQKLRDLRSRLGQSLEHVRHFNAFWMGTSVSLEHLDALCDAVFNDLRTVIEAEIKKLSEGDSSATEVAAHTQFGESRGGRSHFKGRDALLFRIGAYLADPEAIRPLVILGAAGTGKSALLARSSAQAAERFPQAVVLQRYIGATPPSVDGRSLLENLCQELGRKLENAAPVPREYRELVREFRERLAWATPERPVFVYLDALDQLSERDNAKSLVWLPRQLPPNVRVVVSVLDDPTQKPTESVAARGNNIDALAVLNRRSRPEDLLAIDDLPILTAIDLLKSWLEADPRNRRTLKYEHRKLVLAAFERCPRPLFLKLAAEESKMWRSDDSGKMPRSDSADNMLTAIIDQLFDRLSEGTNHGKLLVGRAIGYLVASKNGLTEDELIGLLSSDKEFFPEFSNHAVSLGQPLPPGVDSLPVAVWVRLYSDLEPYLTNRRADGTGTLPPTSRQKRVSDSSD